MKKPKSAEMKPYMAKGPVPDPVRGLRLDLEPFIIPLQPSKKGRILKVVVSLEVPEPDAKQELLAQKRLCRDLVYRLLRDRQVPDLETARSQAAAACPDKGPDKRILAKGFGIQGIFHRVCNNRIG